MTKSTMVSEIHEEESKVGQSLNEAFFCETPPSEVSFGCPNPNILLNASNVLPDGFL